MVPLLNSYYESVCVRLLFVQIRKCFDEFFCEGTHNFRMWMHSDLLNTLCNLAANERKIILVEMYFLLKFISNCCLKIRQLDFPYRNSYIGKLVFCGK